MQTGRGGAAAKAGHDLRMHVTAWEATLTIGEEAAGTSLELDADASSLRVREGTGGMQALGDDDIDNIHQTIDDDVLRRQDIVFRSTSAEHPADGSGISVEGDLTLNRATNPISFDLVIGEDGSLSAAVVVKQSDWGMKPYSALFGALKVKDEVGIVLEGHLPERS